jgi:hypothetical protein
MTLQAVCTCHKRSVQSCIAKRNTDSWRAQRASHCSDSALPLSAESAGAKALVLSLAVRWSSAPGTFSVPGFWSAAANVPLLAGC